MVPIYTLGHASHNAPLAIARPPKGVLQKPKRLFSKQGPSSIFLSSGTLRSKKSPLFSPCFPKFWRCWTFAKPTYLKRGFRKSACSSHCTAKTARASVHNFFSFALLTIRYVGFRPHTTSLRLHPKTRGNQNRLS